MYRFIKLSCALAVAALAFTQCTKDFTDEISVGESQKASATKIINNSHNATDGSLLVKFSESAAVAFENASRSGGVTRSNIEKLNTILLGINATSIERVFPISQKSEESTRRAGLHRWYIVHFDKEQSLDEAAKQLATVAEVDVVEFNTRIDAPAFEPRPTGNVSAAATRLATPDFNDPLASKQWDLHNAGANDKSINNRNAVAGMDINVREAWKYATGDSSIIVAVIDQGVDYTHEDLAANMWVNKGEIADNGIDDDNNGYVDDVHGYNFVDDGPITWDQYYPKTNNSSSHNYGDVGHGTHVAGTIAAVNNNGIGICGIAGGDGTPNSGVKIMSLQVFSGRKSSSNATYAKAWYYAADNGAVLANCSYGRTPQIGSDSDSNFVSTLGIEYEAIEYYRNMKNHPNLTGCIIIAASGNNGIAQSSYPAAYRDYISVSATGIDGMPAYYTNYGPGCNISAPGGDQSLGNNGGILSTLTKGIYGNNDKYDYYQGTSMACPHVVGVAALGLSYAKKLGKVLSTADFNARILLSVNDINSDLENYSSGKYYEKMGTGRVDAFLMMMNIDGTTCIPIPRGKKNFYLDVTPYIADGNSKFQLLDMVISDADMKRLGIKSKPRLLKNNNVFVLTCENSGSAVVEIKMVAGGNTAGTTENVGGMTIIKKFALIVRDNFAENNGWL